MSAERRPLTSEEEGRIRALSRARTDGTLYDVLGLRSDAAVEEIEAAYYELARQWHPDRFYSRDTGDLGSAIEENFVAATRAFRTLRDPLKRQAYHRELGIQGRVVVTAPPPPKPEPVLNRSLNKEVKAGETSPGGTPVYETGLSRPRRVAAPPPPPPPPKPKAPAAVDRIRQQVAEQLVRARQYYDSGKADFDAGRYAKAEGALYLAMKFDPRNTDYAALHEQAAARAREGKARAFIAEAEQEERYQRPKEAMAAYQKAIECDPPEGLAYYRVGMLLKVHEKDDRGALGFLRKAVQKEPNKLPYRMALAEMYETLGLSANAAREVAAVLAVDPKHEAAKAMAKRLRR